MPSDLIAESLADMLGRAAVNAQRLRCACERPLAGVFDLCDWTTCQRCGNLLGRIDFVERTR